MKSVRLATITLIGVAALLAGLACESAPPGQFTADITIGDVGRVTEGKLFVRDGKYRMEFNDGGTELFIVVDEAANLSRSFSPEHKTFIERPANDRQSMMTDQIQGLRMLQRIGEVSDEGTEEIAGYECERSLIRLQGQLVVTQYIANELDFPVKVVNHISEEVFFELSNIRRQAVNDSLFGIPSGYTPKSTAGQGPVEIPNWILGIESAEPMSPPFEITVATGELFRVPVEPGYGLKVHGRNVGEGNASYAAVPFINGLPLKDVSMYTLNLPNQGTGGGWTFEETPLEADQVVVRVSEGTVAFTIEPIELGFGKTIAEGRLYGLSIEPGREVIVRLLNTHSGESVCVVKMSKNFKLLEGDTVGPLSFRTVSLKTTHASERRTYNVDADEIVVEVRKGQMLINIRQP